MESLVKKHINLFVTCYSNLPSITIEEHTIDLMLGAKPLRCHQKRMSPAQCEILRKELDQIVGRGIYHSDARCAMGLAHHYHFEKER